jgi:hypothetical protein
VSVIFTVDGDCPRADDDAAMEQQASHPQASRIRAAQQPDRPRLRRMIDGDEAWLRRAGKGLAEGVTGDGKRTEIGPVQKSAGL